MDTIKAISFSICITIVVTSIFSMLMPHSKLDKVIGFAISLFFLTGIVSPFFSSKISFNISLDDIIPKKSTEYMQTSIQSGMNVLTQKSLENTVERLLEKEKIDVAEVQISINKISYDHISISKVMVYINKSNQIDIVSDTEKITSIVKQQIGVLPEIICV